MPLGFERINERTTRPNPHINFIKPLSTSSSREAEEYLSIIAAIMYPIMKSNHIYVQSLEEFPPNPEFAGRNFNAGEVIQLVIKDRSGRWLPLRHVQMVMVHELAHCKQMNHSKFFWSVRNQYATELKVLWSKRYTGEGLWGRGRRLDGGIFTTSRMPDQSLLPESICGGTYRRRGRKRKRDGSEKPQLSYAERQQRRILKKFGTGGVTLGADEDTKVKLEGGKKAKGKPKVARSARGRELRAAAALARLEKVKEEKIKEEPSDSETDSEYEWPPSDEDLAGNGNIELATDALGHSFVRVCDGEDVRDEDVKREMEEMLLADFDDGANTSLDTTNQEQHITKDIQPAQSKIKEEDISTESESEPENHRNATKYANGDRSITKPEIQSTVNKDPIINLKPQQDDYLTCGICSLANDTDSIVCTACLNVLRPDKMPNHWRCQSLACRDGTYINMGDYGLCQICGAGKPTVLAR